ncbi:MAG: VWA domain-containing protein [Methylophilus sp.]|nr:VWA domain-containing protein [Methylophilus sp.]
MILKINYDLIILVTALILLLIASSQPSVKIMRQQKNYMFVVDVTQSMNVQDMPFAGKPISRLAYTKQLLKQTIENLPCNTKVGLGIFFRGSAALLYTPIETCSNYHALLDTIDHLEWRMASHGSSNIRLGLQSISSLLTTSNVSASVMFFTDGEEAPPLNIFSKTNLSGWQDARGWLLVGIGGNKPTPIPKLNANNEVIGYWSTYSIKIEPATQVNEGANNQRDESIATAPYEYYLSKLDEPYMKELASDIGAQYIKADNAENLIIAMDNLPSNAYEQTKLELNWILALFALLAMLSSYIPDVMHKINTRKKTG